ncbi:hypothetical protein SDC9_11998 [bioreactor metagenome]|uniref:Uncharacterized protein n=1 Tax=bioreactor metagenome TaxID=1076179 RepID=A0A644TH54_9ZZZZ
MIIFRILFLLIFSFLFANSNEFTKDDADIEKLIKAFQENDIEYISNRAIAYPFKREYPIPSIKNQEEFKKRFYEVFDEKLIEKIKNSKIEDWEVMGYRGIMLNSGGMWLNSYGYIIGINYETKFEEKLREDLIKKEKEQLHSSLKVPFYPVYKMKTKNFLIRIDKVKDSYRYSSWKIGKSESSKPDLVLINGEVDDYRPHSKNQFFTFKNKNYTYKIDIVDEGENDMIGEWLEVQKDNKTILLEKGELLNP